MVDARLVFPLVPRWAVIGVSYGTMRSLRRGAGSDVAGSRPYRPGDDVRVIDWAASARLSTAHASDEFVVRERHAEEAPRVVVVCDRRPTMASHAPPLPWLDKPRALRTVVEIVRSSARAAGGYVGYLDHADGELWWRSPQGERALLAIEQARISSREFRAPDDWLERAFEHLAQQGRSLAAGTFVFVVSDFLPAPREVVWLTALEHRWDVVPVVVQDPTWEQSFPDIHGIVLPLRDPTSGRLAPVLLTRREAAARRQANEERLAGLLAHLRALDLDPVLVSASDPPHILGAFLAWSDLRRARRARSR
jgi:uncharacterized protein (DUF58 family)